MLFVFFNNQMLPVSWCHRGGPFLLCRRGCSRYRAGRKGDPKTYVLGEKETALQTSEALKSLLRDS